MLLAGIERAREAGGAGCGQGWIRGKQPVSLAAGEVSEQNLTRWIRDNWPAGPGK